MTMTRALDEIFADIERWHRDHPWQSRWCRLRGRAKDLRYVGRKPKWWWQRARRGYSERDTWSFDRYLARVIAGGCQQLREGHSYPSDMTAERWGAYLSDIETALLAYAEDDYGLLPPEEQRAVYRSAEDAMHRVADRFGDLWD
ncbi:hypothetical protein [Streptomyces griseus]|uniref:hypothetical protein n=1 Tax=Streptomyces griseus TaxID=1911 RepID=UPI0033D3070A